MKTNIYDYEKSQKFICVAECDECEGRPCIATRQMIEERRERVYDYCPVGNDEIWEVYEG